MKINLYRPEGVLDNIIREVELGNDLIKKVNGQLHEDCRDCSAESDIEMPSYAVARAVVSKLGDAGWDARVTMGMNFRVTVDLRKFHTTGLT